MLGAEENWRQASRDERVSSVYSNRYGYIFIVWRLRQQVLGFHNKTESKQNLFPNSSPYRTLNEEAKCDAPGISNS